MVDGETRSAEGKLKGLGLKETQERHGKEENEQVNSSEKHQTGESKGQREQAER